MKVHVDDITLHLRGLGEELPKVAMGAFGKLKDVIYERWPTSVLE